MSRSRIRELTLDTVDAFIAEKEAELRSADCPLCVKGTLTLQISRAREHKIRLLRENAIAQAEAADG